MPQELLPIIPAGATEINDILAVISKNDIWSYYHGVQSIFEHPETDKNYFRMITSQFIYQGLCKPKHQTS